MRALDGMRRFRQPTLILWGKQDTNFGLARAEPLAADIPGTVRIEWLEHSAHMPMQVVGAVWLFWRMRTDLQEAAQSSSTSAAR